MKVSLPKQQNIKESTPAFSGDTLVMVQPKYDGTQGIFTQLDYKGGTECFSRSGTRLTRANTLGEQLEEVFNAAGYKPITLFTELEPLPWSEASKWMLPSLLQSSDSTVKPNFRAVIFDACYTEDFYNGTYLKTPTEERYKFLQSLQPLIANSGIPNVEVTPMVMMPYKEAITEINKSYYTDEHGATRAMWQNTPCEGIVIKHGTSAFKVKPSIERDVYVSEAIQTPKGALGWKCIDTKTEEQLEVWGGVNKDNWEAMVGKVVEVKQLACSGTRGAGNATLIRSREFEKEYTPKQSTLPQR